MLKRFGNDSICTTLHLHMHYNKLSHNKTPNHTLFYYGVLVWWFWRYPGEGIWQGSIVARRVQHGGIAIMMLWNGTSACTEADISDTEVDISSMEAIISGTTSMHSATRLAQKS
ncbi:hypothetical protein Pelo_18485 [Pelomyxa schiedti]|nr:hypothetical protein Pelo_18485 [Pelomyxa schiedti]